MQEPHQSHLIPRLCSPHLSIARINPEENRNRPALPVPGNCIHQVSRLNAKQIGQWKEPLTSRKARVWSSTTTSTNWTRSLKRKANTRSLSKWSSSSCWRTRSWWLRWRLTSRGMPSIGFMCKAQAQQVVLEWATFRLNPKYKSHSN